VKDKKDVFLYCPTASRFKDILSPSGKESAGSNQYMEDILRWTFHGADKENFSSFWTERGRELEGDALSAYILETGIATEKPKFIFNKKYSCGCYPDGTSAEGCVEIKCLKDVNHRDILKNGVPLKFKPQIQGTILITQKLWLDFVAYCPGENLYVERIFPDFTWLGKFIESMAVFNQKLNEKYTNKFQEVFSDES